MAAERARRGHLRPAPRRRSQPRPLVQLLGRQLQQLLRPPHGNPPAAAGDAQDGHLHRPLVQPPLGDHPAVGVVQPPRGAPAHVRRVRPALVAEPQGKHPHGHPPGVAVAPPGGAVAHAARQRQPALRHRPGELLGRLRNLPELQPAPDGPAPAAREPGFGRRDPLRHLNRARAAAAVHPRGRESCARPDKRPHELEHRAAAPGGAAAVRAVQRAAGEPRGHRRRLVRGHLPRPVRGAERRPRPAPRRRGGPLPQRIRAAGHRALPAPGNADGACRAAAPRCHFTLVPRLLCK